MEVQKNPELIRTAFRHLQTKEKSFFIFQLLALPHAKHQLIEEQISCLIMETDVTFTTCLPYVIY